MCQSNSYLFCGHKLYLLTSASGLNSGPLDIGAEAGLGLGQEGK